MCIRDRDGYDVHVTVPITYSQAVTGADVVVPTIDGKVQYTCLLYTSRCV